MIILSMYKDFFNAICELDPTAIKRLIIDGETSREITDAGLDNLVMTNKRRYLYIITHFVI